MIEMNDDRLRTEGATLRWDELKEPSPASLSDWHYMHGVNELTRAFSVSRALDAASMADFPAMINLADLDGSNGFRLNGIDAYDRSGASVSNAGDINGDGFDDVLIGTSGADLGGESYVVFGKAEGFASSLDLALLDGTNGFRLDGIDIGDASGFRLSGAGDINGDGLGDIIIGASGGDPGGEFDAGESYVVFGRSSDFAASFDLASLDGSNGFRIDGIDFSDKTGFSVSDAGDVNGDGFDDVIIGGPYAGPGGISPVDGQSYVVFGGSDDFSASFDLAELDGSNGFRILGIDTGDRAGQSVSSAGDFNGDGFDDILIGAYAASSSYDLEGESYVVFGRAGDFAPSFDLAELDGNNGFQLNGIDFLDFSGFSVSSAGDMNGDGFDDIIIGAFVASPGGDSQAGESYIVFGGSGDFAASLDLASLDGINGFRIDGIDVRDQSGRSVSSAGDVNGDGFDDIIVGALFANPGGELNAGQSYLVFGKSGGFAESLDLSTLDGRNGFRIDGIDENDFSGSSVSTAGDVNGDGFDDMIVGAYGADPGGTSSAGESYVVFGRAPTEAVKRVGSEADQAIIGGDFADTLKGKGGDDVLVGSGGKDELFGNGGADTLVGGAGKDKLKGGGGDDTFSLNSDEAADADKVRGFETGNDVIALDSKVFGLPEGALAARRFVIGDGASDANDRLIYDDDTGKLFFDVDGTGAAEQVLIATLNDSPALEASDFLVI